MTFRVLLIALVAACSGPSGTGNACSADADCEPGATCYRGPNAGYCSVTCEVERSADGCPENTLCKAIQGGEKRCLVVCELEGDCPEGSNCVEVGTGLGKVCEPRP